MEKISNCLLCDKTLKDSRKLFIKNLPESAQGFEKIKGKNKKIFLLIFFSAITVIMFN